MSLLQELGYTRATHFHGGLQEWTAAALPLERDRPALPLLAHHVVGRRRLAIWRWLASTFEAGSTRDLIKLWGGLVLLCALLYWAGTVSGLGALREGERVSRGWAALGIACYFSLVTSASIGFGDVLPTGTSRAVAIVESLGGLLLFGAVVSKLVSRRQEEVVDEIHRIAYEDRLERVQTDLHLVLAELQGITRLCRGAEVPDEQVLARVDSASGMCLAELRTIHALLYRPQSAPEEAMLEGILASLAIVLRELREVVGCLAVRSPYLERNLIAVARLAVEICADCVPRRYAPTMGEWMDRIQAVARELV
ncbi:MAG: potassium channel family protein [Vicinamibacterales bacterium]